MKQYIMAIDQGTTSSRAILFDQASNIIAVAQKELETYYPHPGWVEQNANDLWASVVGVMNEVLARSGISSEQIAAIGITNQRETCVVWEKESGQPIDFAIVWQSRQSDSYCQQLKEEGREAWIRQKTGLQIDPYFSASKLRFLLDKHHAQQRAERGELCFGTIDTWLVWKLTNGKKHITDVSNASRTMLMNLETQDYDEELLKLWNIPRCILPEIVDTSKMLAMSEGVFTTSVPICSIVGDQQAALFGQTCFEEGTVKNTYGTGCFLLMNTKEKIIRSKHGLLTCVGRRINGQTDYVLEGSVFVAGAAIQWLRDGLRIIANSAESESCARSVDSSDGVIVVPAFTGLGAPYWKANAKGAMFGLTRGTKREHIVRATLESLAYQSYDVIAAMQEDAGMKIERLQVDGGASRNEFLMQFQSDLLNAKVIRSTISETTALGAAYLAGLAVGYWKDQTQIREQFQIAHIYEPQMDEKIRQDLLKGWKKAVAATIAFA